MGASLKNKNKFLILCAICFFLFFAISCSQNTPEVYGSNYSVIFEFENADVNPAARLSLFVESESDVRRYERIVIKSKESGYIWDFDDVKKIELDNSKYIGATNIIVPENEVIPSGTYLITCINSDEKEVELQLTVNYDETFYDLKENDVREKMLEKNGFCKIAIYDKDNVMIHFGTKTIEFQTNRDIWNYYRNAAYYQDVWFMPGNSVICILPVHEVVPEL